MKKLFSLAVASAISGVVCAANVSNANDERFDEGSSIWDSDPIEIKSANIQILDKISGNVFKQDVEVDHPIKFESIELHLKRCFKNSPEDYKEIYAFIEIRENGKAIFSQWLFASSPSINIFSHPIYDVRVNFP